jgi:hypothetical protein
MTRSATQLIDVHAHFVTDDYVAAAIAAGRRNPDGMPGWPSWEADRNLQPGRAAVRARGAGQRRRHRRVERLRHLPRRRVVRAGLGGARPAAGGRVRPSDLARLRRDDLPGPPGPDDGVHLRHRADGQRPAVPRRVHASPGHRLDLQSRRRRAALLADRLELFRSAFAGALGPELLGPADAPTVQAQLRRLWFDMAGTPFPNQVPALVKAFGSDRVLYGSDYCCTPAPGVTAQVASVDAASGDGSDDNSGLTDWRALLAQRGEAAAPVRRTPVVTSLCVAGGGYHRQEHPIMPGGQVLGRRRG